MKPDEIRNAVIKTAHLRIEDRDILSAWLFLDYGGSGQGFGGYALDLGPGYTHHDPEKESVFCAKFLRGCLECAGVTEWSDLPGKSIRVRIRDGLIVAIGHIIQDKWLDPKAIVPTKRDAA